MEFYVFCKGGTVLIKLEKRITVIKGNNYYSMRSALRQAYRSKDSFNTCDAGEYSVVLNLDFEDSDDALEIFESSYDTLFITYVASVKVMEAFLKTAEKNNNYLFCLDNILGMCDNLLQNLQIVRLRSARNNMKAAYVSSVCKNAGDYFNPFRCEYNKDSEEVGLLISAFYRLIGYTYAGDRKYSIKDLTKMYDLLVNSEDLGVSNYYLNSLNYIDDKNMLYRLLEILWYRHKVSEDRFSFSESAKALGVESKLIGKLLFRDVKDYIFMLYRLWMNNKDVVKEENCCFYSEVDSVYGVKHFTKIGEMYIIEFSGLYMSLESSFLSKYNVVAVEKLPTENTIYDIMLGSDWNTRHAFYIEDTDSLYNAKAVTDVHKLIVARSISTLKRKILFG